MDFLWHNPKNKLPERNVRVLVLYRKESLSVVCFARLININNKRFWILEKSVEQIKDRIIPVSEWSVTLWAQI